MGVGQTELSLSPHVFFKWIQLAQSYETKCSSHVSCIRICVSCAPGSSFFLSLEPAKADTRVIRTDPVCANYTPFIKDPKSTIKLPSQGFTKWWCAQNQWNLRWNQSWNIWQKLHQQGKYGSSTTLVVVSSFIQLQKNVTKYDQYGYRNGFECPKDIPFINQSPSLSIGL